LTVSFLWEKRYFWLSFLLWPWGEM